MEVREEHFLADEVKELDIEIDCADLVLVKADGEPQIRLTAEVDVKTDYRSAVKDGRLTISCRMKRGGSYRHTNQMPKLTLVLPEKKRFEKICWKLGAGEADARAVPLYGNHISFESGAGNIRTSALSADESVRIETGAGDVKMGKVQTKKASVKCGVGNFYMNGKIEQELVVDCGVGKCRINLEGKETDYHYEASCGLGEVSVNGNCKSGMAGTYVQHNPKAAGKIRISCGLGKVALNIA